MEADPMTAPDPVREALDALTGYARAHSPAKIASAVVEDLANAVIAAYAAQQQRHARALRDARAGDLEKAARLLCHCRTSAPEGMICAVEDCGCCCHPLYEYAAAHRAGGKNDGGLSL